MNENGPVEILLVEDNPYDLELTLRALHKANPANRVQVARDGAEALDYVFGEGVFAGRSVADLPGVVLLDLNLPKIDGLEVLQRLKGDLRTRLVPIVMLTSSKVHSAVVESYGYGANSYIVKPVEFDTFVTAMQHVGLYWLLLNHSPLARG